MSAIFVVSAVAAHAKSVSDVESLFVSKSGPNQLKPVPLRGKVHKLEVPVRVGDEEMVASSELRDNTNVWFSTLGTVYGVYQGSHGPIVGLRISDEGMAAEGYFDFEGQLYVVAQQRVMGVDDRWYTRLYRKLGDRKAKLSRERVVPAATWGLGAALAHFALSQLLHIPVLYEVFPALVAFTSVGAGKYIFDRWDDLVHKSYIELGHKVNFFTKEWVKDLVSYEVIAAKPGIKADIELVTVSRGRIRMSQLVQESKFKYEHGTCIQHLATLRGPISNIEPK